MTAAQEARLLIMPERRAGEKSPVLTDSDLLFLFPGDGTAVRVLLAVKAIAAGELWIDLCVDSIARKLGVSERTVQRAKKRILAAGVRVHDRTNKVGQSMASRWILDRRQVEGLRTSQMSPQGDTRVRAYIDENLWEGSSSPSQRHAAGREPPDRGLESVTAPNGGADPLSDVEATPPDGPPAGLSLPVDLLLEWLGERCELRSEEGRGDAVRLLPEAVRWLDRRLSQVGESSLNVRMAGAWLRASLISGGELRSPGGDP